MRFLSVFVLLLALTLGTTTLSAQSCCNKSGSEKKACCSKSESESAAVTTTDQAEVLLVEIPSKAKEKSFKVLGNCGMCKKRIEGALTGIEGIYQVDWKVETQILTVQFDKKKISLQEIHKKVAAVGHDTEKERAADEVYAKLHGCCQYERAKA